MKISKKSALLAGALSAYSASAIVVDSASTSAYNAATEIAKLPACPTTRTAAYDYIIVGAGAGGGPIAARLALKGFSGELFCFLLVVLLLLSAWFFLVLLFDSGKDWQNVNTTVPLYLSRSVSSLTTTQSWTTILTLVF